VRTAMRLVKTINLRCVFFTIPPGQNSILEGSAKRLPKSDKTATGPSDPSSAEGADTLLQNMEKFAREELKCRVIAPQARNVRSTQKKHRRFRENYQTAPCPTPPLSTARSRIAFLWNANIGVFPGYH
jgi:hypothetical protein